MKEDYKILEKIIKKNIPEIGIIDLDDTGCVEGFGLIEVTIFNKTIMQKLEEFFPLKSFIVSNKASDLECVLVEFVRGIP